MASHNKLRDGVANLVSNAFTPTYFLCNKIYTGRNVRGGKEKLKGSPSKYEGELKGGLLIRDLCTKGMDIIHDMRVMNTDATSYQSKSPKNSLETAKKAKKKKYLHACLK